MFCDQNPGKRRKVMIVIFIHIGISSVRHQSWESVRSGGVCDEDSCDPWWELGGHLSTILFLCIYIESFHIGRRPVCLLYFFFVFTSILFYSTFLTKLYWWWFWTPWVQSIPPWLVSSQNYCQLQLSLTQLSLIGWQILNHPHHQIILEIGTVVIEIFKMATKCFWLSRLCF